MGCYFTPVRPITASVLAVAAAAALSAFSFHAYIFVREGSWERYFPMLHMDEVSYAAFVNAARNGRIDGDIYLYERRVVPNQIERLPARILAAASGLVGIPPHLLPAWSDLVATFLYVPLLFLLFRSTGADPDEALFLAVATLVLFPVVFLAYAPLRDALVGSSTTSTPSLRLFVHSANLFRFWPAQWTHLWFFSVLLGVLRVARRPGAAAAALTGLAAGFAIYLRAYDAMVLGTLLALLAAAGLVRRDAALARAGGIAAAAFALTALPFVAGYLAAAGGAHHREFLERKIVDAVGRGIDLRRLGIFVFATAAAAVPYRLLVLAGRAGPDLSARRALFLLLPASWLPYFHNVLLGYTVQRSHILWWHVFPSILVLGALMFVGAAGRLPDAPRRAVLRAGVAGLLLFHLAYQFLPQARLAGDFLLPPALREGLAEAGRLAGRDGVVASSLSPDVLQAYNPGYSFLATAPNTGASNLDLLERYLLFKRLVLGPRFRAEIRDVMAYPISIAPHMRWTDPSEAVSELHFSFPEGYSEVNQMAFVFVNAFHRRPDLADFLSYDERYGEEEYRRWLASGAEIFLSRAGRAALERIAALPDDPEAILAEIRAHRRLDLLFLRPVDAAASDPAWWGRLLSTPSLARAWERDGYYLLRVGT